MSLLNRNFPGAFLLLCMFISGYSRAQMYDDSLATDRHLQKISSTAFMNVILHATERDQREPLDKLEQLGLYLDSECDEICETYLKEKKGKGEMLLPSDFDQGVMGMVFSPSGKYFVIYSSYDGPDYNSFYHYRAEIIVYPITEGTGLKTIGKPKEYHLYDWSIDELFWKDDNTISLKAYSGHKTIKGVDGGHTYFLLQL